jgi:hypothetical protein
VLPWSAYDPTPTPDAPLGWLRRTPSKSKTRSRPQGQGGGHPRRAPPALAAKRHRVGPVILTHSGGRPWKDADGLSRTFGDAKHEAGIIDLHFNDLRGTAVTRLNEAGCTPQGISPITGHSLASIRRILERYSARTDKLAGNAKLERDRG